LDKEGDLDTAQLSPCDHRHPFRQKDIDAENKFEHAIEASHWLHIENLAGNAVAISKTTLLSALHHNYPTDTPVTLIDIHGISRSGKVKISLFEVFKVDMALIELDVGQNEFKSFIPVHKKGIKLRQKLIVIGLVSGLNGETTLYTQDTQVSVIEPDSALFRSTYYGIEGFSGAGIIMTELDSGNYQLVGVHSAVHDATEVPPDVKPTKKNATKENLSELASSLSKSIHGHMSYCLVSEVFRVPGIMNLL
jgi:hypothetical protein